MQSLQLPETETDLINDKQNLTKRHIMSIKTLKAKIQSIANEMDEEVISRGIYFDEKSEKWQESEKGEAYLEETNALEEAKQLIWESLDYMGEN